MHRLEKTAQLKRVSGVNGIDDKHGRVADRWSLAFQMMSRQMRSMLCASSCWVHLACLQHWYHWYMKPSQRLCISQLVQLGGLC